jgi:hypothetical protein
VANGANISLVISELYLESEYDWVRVYECATNTCSTPDEFNLKRELTGVIPDLVEINVQSVLYVTFTTDRNFVERGFAAQWYATTCFTRCPLYSGHSLTAQIAIAACACNAG